MNLAALIDIGTDPDYLKYELKNIPVKTGLVNQETTTPTGAAVVTTNVKRFTEEIDFKIKKIGYGLGSRDFEVPNVLSVNAILMI